VPLPNVPLPGCATRKPHEIRFECSGDGKSQGVSIGAEVPVVFDQPSLWRIEAANALGLTDDDMIAVMSPGPAFPAVLHSLVAALAPRPNVIIDLGAGTGGLSEWMRVSTGATVHAVEPENGARQTAQLAFPHLRVIDALADSTSLPGGSADAVVISGLTSLMSDIGPTIAEADRLLTSAGRIAVADLFSGTTESWCSAPNVFRSIEDLTRTLHRHGFTTAVTGCGDPLPDSSWAAAAQAVDDWIETHCADRLGYDEWKADRRHLRDHIGSGKLIGGCVVAERTSLDHDCELCE
jgi:precorrin-6B methylase 2